MFRAAVIGAIMALSSGFDNPDCQVGGCRSERQQGVHKQQNYSC